MKQNSVENWIQGLATRILKQTDWNERMMVNGSVTLRKRLRDLTDDDRTGLFSAMTGNWVGIDLSGIYSWNIVKPTIRGNKSSMITANVKVDIEPRFQKDSKSEMAAEVAVAYLEKIERDQWTLKLEEIIADEQQLGAGVFVRAKWNPNIKRASKVAKWETQESMENGEAVCGQCGVDFPINEEVIPDEQGFATVPCEQCGGQAQVMKNPEALQTDVMTGYEEHSFGASETTTHQFWNFRVDERTTQGGDLSKARWFEHHYLVSADELELEYPESTEAVRGSKGLWSYPLRWQFALQTGRNIPVEYPFEMVDEQREIRDIHLTPAMYLNFEAEADFELKDAEGKRRFAIKQGQGFKDAMFEGKAMDEPPVWCFRLLDEHILDIFPCDFREEYFYITFLANPSSFWGLFYTELISLQDIVNYMLTLQVYHIRRNAITSIVYNKGVFNPEDFEEDLIPTKEEFPYDFPIKEQYDIVPALTMSGEPMQMLQMIVQGKGDVTQVQPAMVGESQPNTPYHAQLLQKQQSLGLLSPAELSKAGAKVGWAKQQLRLAKSHWTDEDTEEMLRLNQEWTEDFIEAFLNCDIEDDLIIDFVEGSEIPRSLMEREIQLRQFTQDLAGFAQLNPAILTEETVNDLLMKLAQSGGVDIDINNTESDLRLAESRYDKIKETIQGAKVPPQMAQQAAQQVMAFPDLQPLLFEGHATQIEFYADRIRNESAKGEPDYLLIACLQMEIDMHQARQVQQAQRQGQMQIASTAPQIQLQQQMQQQKQEQSAQQESQDQEQQQAQAQEQQQVQQQDAQRGRDHELLLKSVEMAEREKDRKHELEVASKRGKK